MHTVVELSIVFVLTGETDQHTASYMRANVPAALCGAWMENVSNYHSE